MVAVRHKSHWWYLMKDSVTHSRYGIALLFISWYAVLLSVFLVEATQWNVSRQIQQILQICSHHVKLIWGLTLVRPHPEYGDTLIIQSACKPTDFTVFAASQCLCTWEGRLGKDFWSTLNHIVRNILLTSAFVSWDQGRLIQQFIKPMTQSQLRRAEEEEGEVTGGDQALIKKKGKNRPPTKDLFEELPKKKKKLPLR